MYKKISRDCLTTEAQGSSRGKPQEGQGGLSGSSPGRSDGSRDSQAGEAGLCEGWPKVTQGVPLG
jgi:hypothetical protein